MRYLLLIPSCLMILCALFFYALLMRYRWPKKAFAVGLLAAAAFQFGAIFIADKVH